MQTENSKKVYETAKSYLGKDIALDKTVPNEVQCAQAVSYVLKQCGYNIPEKGISYTPVLLKWLQTNIAFKEIDDYVVGAIIISATGTGNDKIRGHVGVCANYGILSNDSNTGLFLELWNIDKWKKYYETYGGIKIHFFLAK